MAKTAPQKRYLHGMPTTCRSPAFLGCCLTDSVRHLESFAGGILSPILLLPKKKKNDGASMAAPSVLSPLGGSKKRKKKTKKKTTIQGRSGIRSQTTMATMRLGSLDADCHKCRGNLTSIGVRCECLVPHFAYLVLGSALMFFALYHGYEFAVK